MKSEDLRVGDILEAPIDVDPETRQLTGRMKQFVVTRDAQGRQFPPRQTPKPRVE